MGQLTVATIIAEELVSDEGVPSSDTESPVPAELAALAETNQVDESKAEAADEKKPRAARGTKTGPAHPTYFEMIKDAICALKERGGSSTMAIAKYLEEKHKTHLPANFRKILSVQIKRLALSGKLTKIKASFKLSQNVKKEPAKKETLKKTARPAAKTAKKKQIVKKTAVPAAKTAKKKEIVKKTAKTAAKTAKASTSTTSAKPTSKPKVGKKVTNSATGKAPAAKAGKSAKPAATAAKKSATTKKPAPAKKAVTLTKAKPATAKKPKSIKPSDKSYAAKSKTKAPSAAAAKKAKK